MTRAVPPPPPPPVRLIAIDIDGTLLDSRSMLPARNRQAVHRAAAAGIHVVLATGRAFHHATPVAADLGADTPLIVNNGALTKRADGATLDRRLLPRAAALAIVTALRPHHPGVAVVFDRPGADQYLYDGIDWTHPDRQWYYDRHRAFISRAAPIEDALTDDPVQVGYTGRVAEMRALADVIGRLPQAPAISVTRTEYAARDFALIDIIAGGCSKGAALAAWSRRLAVDRTAVMAVGDNLNDREMLAFAGQPVVMGNAVAPLKACGWPTTASHDAAGLARAIEQAVDAAARPAPAS